MSPGLQPGMGREWSASDGAASAGIFDAFFFTRGVHIENLDSGVSFQAQPGLTAKISESFRFNFISKFFNFV